MNSKLLNQLVLYVCVILGSCQHVAMTNLLIIFNGCRTMTFHPDAVCLYCGGENQLKVYGWEPARCFDTLTTGWGRVSDIAVAQKQLVCVSSSVVYFNSC